VCERVHRLFPPGRAPFIIGSMDVILFWVVALMLFAALSLLFAPDSRDTRRAIDRHGSWAALTA